MYDSAVIEEIKYCNDLSDVISSYVALKRTGSGLTGLCPFHSEKTPSFHVVPEKGFFHCFGCGAGGDVITFIMRIENLEYPQAVEFLAARAGITLPENGKSENGGVGRARIKQMNRDAARFFHDQLKLSPVALSYLRKRGLSGAAIKHFGIGYSPEKPWLLHDHMRSLGYTGRGTCRRISMRNQPKDGKNVRLFSRKDNVPRNRYCRRHNSIRRACNRRFSSQISEHFRYSGISEAAQSFRTELR